MDNQAHQIKIDFKMTDEDGTVFADAIYMTPEEFAVTTQDQLEQMKLDRFNNWKAQVQAAMNAPQPDPVEVAAALALEIENLTQQKDLQVEQIATTTNQPVEVVEQQVVQKIEEIKNTDNTENIGG